MHQRFAVVLYLVSVFITFAHVLDNYLGSASLGYVYSVHVTYKINNDHGKFFCGDAFNKKCICLPIASCPLNK